MHGLNLGQAVLNRGHRKGLLNRESKQYQTDTNHRKGFLLGPLLIIAVALLLFAAEAFPEDSVSVPWSEFRTLFKESLEQKFKESRPKPPAPQMHTLDSAVYYLDIKGSHVQGRLELNGQVLSGGPEAIPLFSSDLVIDAVLSISGGHLLCRPKCSSAVAFLPQGPGPFRIEVSFLAPLVEDHRQGTVMFSIPQALYNTVHLASEDLPRLLSEPGIKAADGSYRFSVRDTLTLRLAKANTPQGNIAPKVDLYSVLRWESSTLYLETFFWPRQPLPFTYELEILSDFALVSASLAAADLTQINQSRLKIRVPAGTPLPFSIIQSRQQADQANIKAFRLPFIKGNSGSQGNLVLEQPSHSHMRLSQPEQPAGLSLAAAAEDIQEVLGKTGYFLQMDAQTPLTLVMKRFQEISAPPLVLDTIAFYTAIEENGSQLSTLIMEVPPEAGARLAVKPVAHARIWRLLVNGQPGKVFSQEDGTWMIPLDAGRISRIELSLLIQGEKLGLRGRLAFDMPTTGLPCQRLLVGIALPERVELLSMEGAVTPALNDPADPPDSFLIGHTYFFTRDFYSGERLPLAVAYKEPAQAQRQPDQARFRTFKPTFMKGNRGGQGNLVLEKPSQSHMPIVQPEQQVRLPVP